MFSGSSSLTDWLYSDELQRQTEVEELFRGHMFKLASQERSDADDKERMNALEKRLQQLEKQSIHDRVATSTALLKVHSDQIKTCGSRVDAFDEKFTTVDTQLATLQKQASETAAAVKIAQEAAEKPTAPEQDPALKTAKQEIDVLFVDRDNILAMVEDAKTRLTRLEENLRALTLQRAPAAKSPGIPHRLPVTTSNGSQLDLGVPKGMAHVGLRKENANVRSFSPGKQWS